MSEEKEKLYLPKSRIDAIIRDLVTDIPVIGDAMLIAEAISAFKNKKWIAGLVYVLNASPLPTVPLSHLVVYEMEKRKEEEKEEIKEKK
ncbi:MAG: hypothetical protein LZ173_02040 [Thaumarchaeota archaeon]|nr:hypothetical protein [Candidatus Geocrenenecus arthurdayi]